MKSAITKTKQGGPRFNLGNTSICKFTCLVKKYAGLEQPYVRVKNTSLVLLLRINYTALKQSGIGMHGLERNTICIIL